MTEERKNTNQANVATAGIVGAVVGAGVAVVATKVLSNAKTRKALIEKAGNLKNKVFDSIEEAKDRSEELKNSMDEQVAKGKKEIKKMADQNDR